MKNVWYKELMSFKRVGKELPFNIGDYINFKVGNCNMPYITSEELENMWEEINK